MDCRVKIATVQSQETEQCRGEEDTQKVLMNTCLRRNSDDPRSRSLTRMLSSMIDNIGSISDACPFPLEVVFNVLCDGLPFLSTPGR